MKQAKDLKQLAENLGLVRPKPKPIRKKWPRVTRLPKIDVYGFLSDLQAKRLSFGQTIQEIFSEYPKADKIWGREVILCNTLDYACKMLIVNPRMRCSLHRHAAKVETLFMLGGTLNLECGTDRRNMRVLSMNLSSRKDIPEIMWHRFENPDFLDPAILLEISRHSKEDDIERDTPSGEME